MSELLIRRATLDEVLPLRALVLRAGGPVESARLPGDDRGEGVHWSAWINGEIVACTSLYTVERDGVRSTQLRGAATREGHRGMGVGGKVIEAALSAWRETPPVVRPLWCNARIAARTFYERHGFMPISEPFDVEGVGPHIRMQLHEETAPGGGA